MSDAKEPAAIAALREVAHPTSVGTVRIVYADILQAWDTLTRERDEARRDAERYRYLRQGDGRLYITPGPDEGNSCGAVQGAVADQAIDAARTAVLEVQP